VVILLACLSIKLAIHMRLSVLRLEDLAGDIHMKISFFDATSQ
jgi:hypothetical protein